MLSVGQGERASGRQMVRRAGRGSGGRWRARRRPCPAALNYAIDETKPSIIVCSFREIINFLFIQDFSTRSLSKGFTVCKFITSTEILFDSSSSAI